MPAIKAIEDHRALQVPLVRKAMLENRECQDLKATSDLRARQVPSDHLDLLRLSRTSQG